LFNPNPKEYAMFSIVTALIARLKALFVTHAVLEIEAELIASCAERKAELLRQAKRYEQEGLQGIAQNLRRQADELSAQKPLGSVLPAIAHVQADHPETKPDHQALPTPSKNGGSRNSDHPRTSTAASRRSA
jgi:hypothetical protein